MFGEIAALGRTQRSATVFAQGEAELLEIRWQGFREIRKRNDEFRKHVDNLYRQRSLTVHLQATPMFEHISEDIIAKIADETLFEGSSLYLFGNATGSWKIFTLWTGDRKASR